MTDRLAQWGHVQQVLNGPLRIAVGGADSAAIHRVIAALPSTVEGVALSADSSLLTVHAAVWLTSATTPLPQSERLLLDALADAPADAVIVLTGAHVLDQMSDDPDSERAAVSARVSAVAPAPWRVVPDLDAYITSLSAPDLRASRLHAIGERLLDLAQQDAATAHAELDHTLATQTARAARLTTEHTANQRLSAQTAAHVQGSLTQHTETLRAELSAFLYELERALPAEIAAAPDPATAAVHLGPWLTEVLHQWFDDATARWHAAVATDLADIADDALLDALHLLTPASTASSGEARPWRHRLLVSSAIGGGAALALAGVWAPGLSIAAGGIAIAGATRWRDRPTAASVTEQGIVAVRITGRDSLAALDTQLAELARTLAQIQTGSLDASRAAADDAHRVVDALRTDQAIQRERIDRVLADVEQALTVPEDSLDA